LSSVLFLFIDGIGLAPPSCAASNPLRSGTLRFLERLVGGGFDLSGLGSSEGVCLRALDANLGVAGLPQSATGQTALFTGENAARFMGRHVAAFPGPRLSSLIERDNLFTRALAMRKSVCFANAFSPLYHERLSRRRLRESVTVRCARSAQIELLGLGELAAGRAVSWDIQRDLFLENWATAAAPGRLRQDDSGDFRGLQPVSSLVAGAHLAALLHHHELVVYESFLPDLVGHGRGGLSIDQVLARLDGLLEGAIRGAAEGMATVVMTSDHGNCEEMQHKRHTRNPVPLLAVGPAAVAFADCESLCDVMPAILKALSAGP
jgi:hypothetical protein